MTARIVLSYMLDIFRCRKSILRQANKSNRSNFGSEFSLKTIASIPDGLAAVDLVVGLPTKPKELQLQLPQEPEKELQFEMESVESQRGTEKSEQEKGESEIDGGSDVYKDADNHNSKAGNQDSVIDADNDKDIYIDVEIDSDNDNDNDEFGYDDPRLPEMII